MRFDPYINVSHANEIRALVANAFPSDFENKLITKLRAGNAMHAEHGLWDDHKLIGHVAYSPVNVEGCSTSKILLGLGPMAIDPAYQGKGLGMQLLQQSLNTLTGDAVILLGHLGFYDKAGFKPAADFNLHFSDNAEIEAAFMALELSPDSLKGLKGRVLYHPAFYEE